MRRETFFGCMLASAVFLIWFVGCQRAPRTVVVSDTPTPIVYPATWTPETKVNPTSVPATQVTKITAPPALQRIVSTKYLMTMGSTSYISPTLTVSPDLRHIAFAFGKGETYQKVYLDGHLLRQYTRVKAAQFAFSPDSERLAYIVYDGDKQTVIVDGKTGEPYDNIGINTLTFSPDSKHLAYMAKKGELWGLVEDGQEHEFKYTYYREAPVTYSPNSHDLVYIVGDENERLSAVFNDKPGPFYEDIQYLAFSPDGLHLAYRATDNGVSNVIFDDKAEPPQPAINAIAFSPDSQHFTYIVHTGRGDYVVRDGKPGKIYPAIHGGCFSYSPDSQHIAYPAETQDHYLLVMDDQETIKAGPAGCLRWSPNSRQLLDLVVYADGMRVEHEKEVGPKFNFIYPKTVTFSPNTDHIAYIADLGNTESVILEDTVGKGYDEIISLNSTSIVFDSPNQFHYIARDGSIISVVDEQIIQTQ